MSLAAVATRRGEQRCLEVELLCILEARCAIPSVCKPPTLLCLFFFARSDIGSGSEAILAAIRPSQWEKSPKYKCISDIAEA